MPPILWQIIAPLALSSCVVILVTFIAERYGTKIGGILGTLPSTIVIAFLIIALNKDANFASSAAVIVPAEMGINTLFLFVLILMIHHGLIYALCSSLSIWCISSGLLYFSKIDEIIFSLGIFIILMMGTFILMEKHQKIKSKKKVTITYTPKKILFRGIFAGIMISIAVLLSNINEILSGIFSVFPAIFLSTMIICVKEHGPDFTGALAKSMVFGTPTVVSYAISIHFLYPVLNISWGTVLAYGISLIVLSFIYCVKKRII